MSDLNFNSGIDLKRLLGTDSISPDEQNKKSQEQEETPNSDTNKNNNINCSENNEGSLEVLDNLAMQNYLFVNSNSSANNEIKDISVEDFYALLDTDNDGEIVAEDVISAFNTTKDKNLKAILEYFTDGENVTDAFKIACAGLCYDSYETWNKGITKGTDDADMIAKNGIISKDSLERLKELAKNPSTKTVSDHLDINRANQNRNIFEENIFVASDNRTIKTAKDVVIEDYSKISIEDFYALLDTDGDGEIVAKDVIIAYNNTANEDFKTLLSFLTDGKDITKAFKLACAGVCYDSYETWNKGITNGTDDPDMISKNGFVTKESLARLAELAKNPTTETVLTHLKFNRSDAPETGVVSETNETEEVNEGTNSTTNNQVNNNKNNSEPNTPNMPISADNATNNSQSTDNNTVNNSNIFADDNENIKNNEIDSNVNKISDKPAIEISNNVETITPGVSAVNNVNNTTLNAIKENTAVLIDTIQNFSEIHFPINIENQINENGYYRSVDYSYLDPYLYTDPIMITNRLENLMDLLPSEIINASDNGNKLTYDENNRLVKVESMHGIYEFAYNKNGQLAGIKESSILNSNQYTSLMLSRDNNGAISSIALTNNLDCIDYLLTDTTNSISADNQASPNGYVIQAIIDKNSEITGIRCDYKENFYSDSHVSASNPAGLAESRSISYTLDKDWNYNFYNAKEYTFSDYSDICCTEFSLDGKILTKHHVNKNTEFEETSIIRYEVSGNRCSTYYDETKDKYLSATKLLSQTEEYRDTYGGVYTSQWLTMGDKLNYASLTTKKDNDGHIILDENGNPIIVTNIATDLTAELFASKPGYGHYNDEVYFQAPVDYTVEYMGNAMEKILPGAKYLSYDEDSAFGNQLKAFWSIVPTLTPDEYNKISSELVNSKEFRIAYLQKALEDNLYEAQLIEELQGIGFVSFLNGSTDTLESMKNNNEKTADILRNLKDLVEDTDAFNNYYKEVFGKEFSIENFNEVNNHLSQSESLSLLAEANGIAIGALKDTAKTAATLALGLATGLTGAPVLVSIGSQGILSTVISLWENALDGNVSEDAIYQASLSGTKTMLYNILGIPANAAGEVVAQKLVSLGTSAIASKIVGFGVEVASDTAISYVTTKILRELGLGDDTSFASEFQQSFIGNLIGGLTAKLSKDVKARNEEINRIQNDFNKAGAKNFEIKTNFIDGSYKVSFEYNSKKIEIDNYNKKIDSAVNSVLGYYNEIFDNDNKFALISQIAEKPEIANKLVSELDAIVKEAATARANGEITTVNVKSSQGSSTIELEIKYENSKICQDYTVTKTYDASGIVITEINTDTKTDTETSIETKEQTVDTNKSMLDILAEVVEKTKERERAESKEYFSEKVLSDEKLSKNFFVRDVLDSMLSEINTKEQADAKLYLLNEIFADEKVANNEHIMYALNFILADVETKNNADTKLYLLNEILSNKNLSNNIDLIGHGNLIPVFDGANTKEIADARLYAMRQIASDENLLNNEKISTALVDNIKYVNTDEQADAKISFAKKILSDENILNDEKVSRALANNIQYVDTEEKTNAMLSIAKEVVNKNLSKSENVESVLPHCLKVAYTSKEVEAMVKYLEAIQNINNFNTSERNFCTQNLYTANDFTIVADLYNKKSIVDSAERYNIVYSIWKRIDTLTKETMKAKIADNDNVKLEGMLLSIELDDLYGQLDYLSEPENVGTANVKVLEGTNNIEASDRIKVERLKVTGHPNNTERMTLTYPDGRVIIRDWELDIASILTPKENGTQITKAVGLSGDLKVEIENGKLVITEVKENIEADEASINLESEIKDGKVIITNNKNGKSISFSLADVINATNDLEGQIPISEREQAITTLFKQLSPTTILDIYYTLENSKEVKFPYIFPEGDHHCVTITKTDEINPNKKIFDHIKEVTLSDDPATVNHEILHAITDIYDIFNNGKFVETHTNEANHNKSLLLNFSRYGTDGNGKGAERGLQEFISIVATYNLYGIELIERGAATRLAYPKTSRLLELTEMAITQEILKQFDLL